MSNLQSTENDFSTFDRYSNEESQWLVRNAKIYKKGFQELLVDFEPDFYCVANFYDDARSADYYEDKFSRFDTQLCQALLGRKFRAKPWERPRWIAVPERATSIHYNVLCQVPAAALDKFCEEAPPIWRKLVRSGGFDVKRVGPSQVDDEKIGSYLVKAFSPMTTIDRTIVNWMYWPKQH